MGQKEIVQNLEGGKFVAQEKIQKKLENGNFVSFVFTKNSFFFLCLQNSQSQVSSTTYSIKTTTLIKVHLLLAYVSSQIV